MKKTLAIILVLVFAAFAFAGKADLTQAEREEIFYEVAKEKGIDLNILQQLEKVSAVQTAIQNGDDSSIQEYLNPDSVISVKNSAGNSSSVPDPTTEDYLTVTDLKLIPIEGTIYRPNLRVKCLFPDNLVTPYPEQMELSYALLDENGDIVDSCSLRLNHLSYNQGGWTEALSVIGADNLDVSKVKALVFTDYMMWSSGFDSFGSKHWSAVKPVRFEFSDLLGEESGQAAGDPISVESVSLRRSSSNCAVDMKVRNLGDQRRDVITLNYQALDENGDIVASGDVNVKDLDPGQAAKSGFTRLKCDIRDVASIKITDYSYGFFNGGSRNSWTTPVGSSFRLSEPIVFTRDEIIFE